MISAVIHARAFRGDCEKGTWTEKNMKRVRIGAARLLSTRDDRGNLENDTAPESGLALESHYSPELSPSSLQFSLLFFLSSSLAPPFLTTPRLTVGPTDSTRFSISFVPSIISPPKELQSERPRKCRGAPANRRSATIYSMPLNRLDKDPRNGQRQLSYLDGLINRCGNSRAMRKEKEKEKEKTGLGKVGAGVGTLAK